MSLSLRFFLAHIMKIIGQHKFMNDIIESLYSNSFAKLDLGEYSDDQYEIKSGYFWALCLVIFGSYCWQIIM